MTETIIDLIRERIRNIAYTKIFKKNFGNICRKRKREA